MKHRIVPLLLLLIATASYASQTYCIDIQTKELCPVDFMIEPTITAQTEDDGITVTYEIPLCNRQTKHWYQRCILVGIS
ncbi:MAG: hypothetical protein K1V89_00825 [Muribaculaceae bacterium]